MYYSAKLVEKRSEIRGIMKFGKNRGIDEMEIVSSVMEIYKISKEEAIELCEYVRTHLH